MKRVRLGFKKLRQDAVIPEYAHDGDAGMDIMSVEDVVLPLYMPVKVGTGIAADIPAGYELQVRTRSGLACKGVTVVNSPGTIDSGYRGEICVILMYINSEVEEDIRNSVDVFGNMTMVSVGKRPKTHYQVKAGDKIAQLVLAPITFANPVEVEELSVTERGSDGFGSTGV